MPSAYIRKKRSGKVVHTAPVDLSQASEPERTLSRLRAGLAKDEVLDASELEPPKNEGKPTQNEGGSTAAN